MSAFALHFQMLHLFVCVIPYLATASRLTALVGELGLVPSTTTTTASGLLGHLALERITELGTANWGSHPIRSKALMPDGSENYQKEYEITKEVFELATEFGCQWIEGESASCIKNPRGHDSRTGALPIRQVKKYFNLNKCLVSADAWVKERLKSDDCLFFARAGLYAVQPMAELLMKHKGQNYFPSIFKDVETFAPVVLDRFGAKDFNARDRALLMHFFAELLGEFYQRDAEFESFEGAVLGRPFGMVKSLRGLSELLRGSSTCDSKELGKKALDKIMGVFPFIVVPLLHVDGGAYADRTSELVRFAGESTKELLPMLLAFRRDYGLETLGLGTLLKVLPSRSQCASDGLPSIAAFSANMLLWASMYLQTEYGPSDEREPHLLQSRVYANSERRIKIYLKEWEDVVAKMPPSLMSIGQKVWIDQFYAMLFPGVEVLALQNAFYKPELLLRYVRSQKDHTEVVNVMQEWVKAVVQDFKSRAEGAVGNALMNLRTGQMQVAEENKRHLDVLKTLGVNVDLWINAPELEQDPETLFYLGEAVASCQAITGTLSKHYAKALTSYLAVGHIGALVAASGRACDPLRRGARTCENLEMRAIVRFLYGQKGSTTEALDYRMDDVQPVLLLEKPYKGIGRRAKDPRTQQAAWRVLSKALALCHKLGADLLVEDVSGWDKYTANLNLKYDASDERWTLESAGGFSPYTYSDAAAGTITLTGNHRYTVGVFKQERCQQIQSQIDNVAARI